VFLDLEDRPAVTQRKGDEWPMRRNHIGEETGAGRVDSNHNVDGEGPAMRDINTQPEEGCLGRRAQDMEVGRAKLAGIHPGGDKVDN
jgi:hypothetical protein